MVFDPERQIWVGNDKEATKLNKRLGTRWLLVVVVVVLLGCCCLLSCVVVLVSVVVVAVVGAVVLLCDEYICFL